MGENKRGTQRDRRSLLKETPTQVFPVNIVKYLRTAILKCICKQQMFFAIAVLKYFTIFTGKPMCWSLFLIKFNGMNPGTLDPGPPSKFKGGTRDPPKL